MSPGNERGRPGQGGAPFEIADGDEHQFSDRITYPAREAADYGQVLECVMACAGSKHCAWRPAQCKLVLGGDS